MFTQCTQTLSNGNLCSAPCVDGTRFCRHHDPQRPAKQVKASDADHEPLALPPLTDKPSILAAVNEVVQALAEGRIKRSVAETLLSAIKLANRLLNEITEAGLSLDPTQLPSRRPYEPATKAPRSTWQPTGEVASRIAASGNSRKATSSFSPSHRPSADERDIDPATDRLIREVVAQSQELAAKQSLRP